MEFWGRKLCSFSSRVWEAALQETLQWWVPWGLRAIDFRTDLLWSIWIGREWVVLAAECKPNTSLFSLTLSFC